MRKRICAISEAIFADFRLPASMIPLSFVFALMTVYRSLLPRSKAYPLKPSSPELFEESLIDEDDRPPLFCELSLPRESKRASTFLPIPALLSATEVAVVLHSSAWAVASSSPSSPSSSSSLYTSASTGKSAVSCSSSSELWPLTGSTPASFGVFPSFSLLRSNDLALAPSASKSCSSP